MNYYFIRFLYARVCVYLTMGGVQSDALYSGAPVNDKATVEVMKTIHDGYFGLYYFEETDDILSEDDIENQRMLELFKRTPAASDMDITIPALVDLKRGFELPRVEPIDEENVYKVMSQFIKDLMKRTITTRDKPTPTLGIVAYHIYHTFAGMIFSLESRDSIYHPYPLAVNFSGTWEELNSTEASLDDFSVHEPGVKLLKGVADKMQKKKFKMLFINVSFLAGTTGHRLLLVFDFRGMKKYLFDSNGTFDEEVGGIYVENIRKMKTVIYQNFDDLDKLSDGSIKAAGDSRVWIRSPSKPPRPIKTALGRRSSVYVPVNQAGDTGLGEMDEGLCSSFPVPFAVFLSNFPDLKLSDAVKVIKGDYTDKMELEGVYDMLTFIRDVNKYYMLSVPKFISNLQVPDKLKFQIVAAWSWLLEAQNTEEIDSFFVVDNLLDVLAPPFSELINYIIEQKKPEQWGKLRTIKLPAPVRGSLQRSERDSSDDVDDTFPLLKARGDEKIVVDPYKRTFTTPKKKNRRRRRAGKLGVDLPAPLRRSTRETTTVRRYGYEQDK